MLALLIFGPEVERTLGTRHFLILYFAAVVSAALVQLLVVTMASENGIYPTVGASGGIFGVLLAFGMLFPHRPLPAWLLVTMCGLLELANGVLGTELGVAHFAHLGGMLGAYLELTLWRRHHRLERW